MRPDPPGIRTIGAGLFLMALAGCLPAHSGDAYLIQQGQPRADIVISSQPPRAVKLAAVELQDYLCKISGARLPIVAAPATNACAHVYVGRSADTDRLRISDEGLKAGAFRMVSGRDWLALVGHDADFVLPAFAPGSHQDWARALKAWDARTGETWDIPFGGLYRRYSPRTGLWDQDRRGSLNAVYTFLQDLGVRWYMPGDLGEIVPRQPTVSIPTVDKIVRPDFACRNLGDYSPHFDGGSRDAVLWRFRVGLDPAPDVVGLFTWAHALNNVHGRSEVRKAHPEYFALYGGKRATEGPYFAPCLSSKGLFDSTVKYARTMFDLFPDEPIISVMPNDGYVSLCECDGCRGKGTPERGPEGKMSDYVWDFVNRVAIELYKTHPDRKVISGAYGPYSLPPEKIARFSPNVVVGLNMARTAATRAKALQVRQAFLEKLAPGNAFTWGHYLSSRPGCDTEGLPVYFPHAIAEDLRSLKGISQGEYIELSQGPDDMQAPGFNHLNVYITAHGYWNAGQEVNALLEEYYRLFYGPAANDMKSFIEYSETNWPFMRTRFEAVDQALTRLAAARRAAGDTVYGRRIDLVARHVRPMHDLRQRLAVDRTGAPKTRIFDANPAEITLDGQLTENCWTNGGHGWWSYAHGLSDLETGREPFSPTSFRLLWTDRTLWVGIRCTERDMPTLNIAATNRDDAIIILIETQGHSYYEIAVNPAGAVFDADRKGGVNAGWSSGAEVAVRREATAWNIEMRLPVGDMLEGGADLSRCMDGRRPSRLYPWYFNVCRQRVRGQDIERQAFSPTERPDFYVPASFAELTDSW